MSVFLVGEAHTRPVRSSSNGPKKGASEGAKRELLVLGMEGEEGEKELDLGSSSSFSSSSSFQPTGQTHEEDHRARKNVDPKNYEESKREFISRNKTQIVVCCSGRVCLCGNCSRGGGRGSDQA